MLSEHLPPLPASPGRHTPPPGSVDCHAHVFGPLERFPVSKRASYQVFELPTERYLGMLDRVGLTRGVLVTPSAYGSDNGVLLNALSAQPRRLRGVAVVSEKVGLAELEAMQQAGVRGVRFTELPQRLIGFRGTVGYPALRALAPALRDLGLHAQIWTSCELFADQHRDLLDLDVPIVLDHMGMFDPELGTQDRAFLTLLDVLREGLVWVKLVAYRISPNFPDYDDLRPFHEEMVLANADRIVWGTDWPHVRVGRDMPADGHLLDLLIEWTHDSALVQKILVDNPTRLYGF